MTKRLSFFLGHLFISFLIAVLIVGVIFLFWYPNPLASAVGVTQIFLMILVIDVILGPLLGLLVYKEGKKSLVFDLSIIIMIQISALCYGVYSIEQGRPVWLVYNVDRFELIRKNELIEDNIKDAKTQFQRPSWSKPQLVATEFSQDTSERNDDMFAEVFEGISITQKPERYVDLFKAKSKIQQRALPIKVLEKYNSKDSIDKLIKKYPNANAWLPLKAPVVDMAVLINKDSAEVIKIVDLRPWD